MNVLELALSVPNQLVSDLHHPVGAALGERRYKHVLLAGDITAKRILLLERLTLPDTPTPKNAIRAAGFLQHPHHWCGEQVHHDAEHHSKRQRRPLAHELLRRRADFGSRA